MARFYFHFRWNERFIFDDIGAEFDSVSAAHVHAVRITEEALPFLLTIDPRDLVVEVADENGRTVLTVLFPTRSDLRSRHRRKPMEQSWRSLL